MFIEMRRDPHCRVHSLPAAHFLTAQQAYNKIFILRCSTRNPGYFHCIFMHINRMLQYNMRDNLNCTFIIKTILSSFK
jgi:hypothetical protein